MLSSHVIAAVNKQQRAVQPQTLLFPCRVPSFFSAGVKQCHVCKSSQAGATFANLVCDRIPAMAPDCDNFNKSSLSFLQFCSANQNCLFISKGSEWTRARICIVQVV